MLDRAMRRIADRGWRKVRLIEADARRLAIRSGSADPVLCFHAHDVLRSPAAVQGAFTALKPGGRLVAGGGKRTPSCLLLDLLTLAYSQPFVSGLRDLSPPWARLEELTTVEVEQRFCGAAYILRALRR